MANVEEAHQDMIDQLIAHGSLSSSLLISAFRATPRHFFLDRLYSHQHHRWFTLDPALLDEEGIKLIYTDRAVTTRLSTPLEGESPIAISSSSQPSLMAQMLEDLDLAPGLRILEIGAGTGYNAALLSHAVGPLISIDIDREVLAEARRHLDSFPDRQVALFHFDGRQGFPEAAPFDRIQVTAATDDLAPAWLAQLTDGGIVQAPLDLAPGLAAIVQLQRHNDRYRGRLMRAAYFMPLRSEGEPSRDRNVPTSPLPGPARLQRVSAPWGNWQDRRMATDGQEFLPGVALLGWLEGLALGYSAFPDGRMGHGLVDLVRGEACWMNNYEWRVSGAGGEELGHRLWRRWLNLGGPRPGDWRIRVGGDTNPAIRAEYVKQGRCGEMVWELPQRIGHNAG